VNPVPAEEENVPQVQPEPEPIHEPEPEPVPEAKEDEVIIIEKAEEVVPLPPPVIEEKPKDITYKIKWGDTLWDIADTYYKNPWRYKKIAAYNKIKNPDYIISGTTILIPAE
jgi:nucleoid-associated protein YgaU